jgi:hypothetical protein
MKRAIVITTINHPNNVLKTIAEEATKRNIYLIIIGDKKTPASFSLKGADYLSLENQNHLFGDFSKKLKIGHYSRKNIGYLQAVKGGSQMIQETDDDNSPLISFWEIPEPATIKIETVESAWFNIYSMFSNELIWPRGFPLESIKTKSFFSKYNGKYKGLIYQGLVNENPDVDAIYRLTQKLPLEFMQNKSVFLANGVWSPFNSQNTIFYPKAYPLLYLPSYCTFRMTDIWRSLIAQRCLWEIDSGVVFHAASVTQDRNEHSLIKDFEDEIPGYTSNNKIRIILEKTKLEKGDMFRNLIICYEQLTNAGFIERKEINLVKLWINELGKYQN